MDMLTDILEQAGLRRRLLDLRHLAPGSALEFPCNRSMGLHVVMRGRAYVHAEGLHAPLALAAGDVAVMARGQSHLLSAGPDLAGAARIDLADLPPAPPEPENTLISGAYQFWNAPVHPFFADLPDWSVLRGGGLPDVGPLARALALLAAEIGRTELGADAIVNGLLDVIFTYALREIVARTGKSAAGWSHAVSDPKIRQVVARLQQDCARPWSLEDLADAGGMSRTALAERFRQAMNNTPLAYLRTIRIQKAMRLLSDTDHTMEQIAQEVGYQDAFSFSKAFKRTTGDAPRDFRRRNLAEADAPWRLLAR